MGVQFEQLTHTPHQSLSFLVKDINRARRDGFFSTGNLGDLEAWINVLKSWSAPLVSDAGRRGIEMWLDTVEADAAESAA